MLQCCKLAFFSFRNISSFIRRLALVLLSSGIKSEWPKQEKTFCCCCFEIYIVQMDYCWNNKRSFQQTWMTCSSNTPVHQTKQPQRILQESLTSANAYKNLARTELSCKYRKILFIHWKYLARKCLIYLTDVSCKKNEQTRCLLQESSSFLHFFLFLRDSCHFLQE